MADGVMRDAPFQSEDVITLGMRHHGGRDSMVRGQASELCAAGQRSAQLLNKYLVLVLRV